MIKVWVTYPGGTIVRYANRSSEKIKTRTPTKRFKMIYHGPTANNARAIIVEDRHGNVHVVSADIVKFV